MNIPNTDPADGGMPLEFPALVERKLAGTITAQEQVRMENHLRENLAAMDYYISLSMVEGLLPAALKRPVPAREMPAAWRRWRPWIAGMAASLALAGTAFLVWRPRESATPAVPGNPQTARADGGVPCRLYNAIGVVWESPATLPGSRLSASQVAIASGVAELVLDSGVRLLMEGPAKLEVTGRNAGRLAYGKVVADVPDGAQGFSLDTPTDKVIDHGTSFALRVDRDGGGTTLGVLSGIVDLQTKNETVRLYTDYAVEHGQNGVLSVPFERDRFFTQLPSAELPWNLDGMPFKTPRMLRVVLPPVMGIPGDLQIVFKRLAGYHTIAIRKVSLLHNGQPVARADEAWRRVGVPDNTRNNIVVLRVPDDAGTDGRWELEMEMSCNAKPHVPAPGAPPATRPPSLNVDGSINPNNNAILATLAQGVMLVNKGVFAAKSSDFVGRWEYSHNNHTYMREFLPEGRFMLYRDGEPILGKDDAHWSVAENILAVAFAKNAVRETHMLSDRNTLIFLNTPYRNARRMAGAKTAAGTP